MRLLRTMAAAACLLLALACGGGPAPAPAAPAGPAVDPATAGSVTATVRFEGDVPAPQTFRIDGDPKCVSESGGAERADESLLVGAEGALENVFVYVAEGLEGRGFPVPAAPVVLDQEQCRYTPRVLGLQVGQALEIRNSDPLLHNVRANGVINQAFNISTPVEGMRFERTFATREVMVPFKCDVHGWMSAYVGVLDHPYFAVTGADGRAAIADLPPGTYTLEAWHERLGTARQQVTLAAKASTDVAFTFALPR